MLLAFGFEVFGEVVDGPGVADEVEWFLLVVGVGGVLGTFVVADAVSGSGGWTGEVVAVEDVVDEWV